jgi:DNA mismatch repair protein MutS
MHPKADDTADAETRVRPNGGHIQLGLFSPMERKLVETLQMLDVSRITPVDALNILNELQIKAQSVVY